MTIHPSEKQLTIQVFFVFLAENLRRFEATSLGLNQLVPRSGRRHTHEVEVAACQKRLPARCMLEREKGCPEESRRGRQRAMAG